MSFEEINGVIKYTGELSRQCFICHKWTSTPQGTLDKDIFCGKCTDDRRDKRRESCNSKS